MEKFFTTLLAGSVFFISCGGGGGGSSTGAGNFEKQNTSNEQNTSSRTASEWLILIYMDGDNNLSEYSYKDLQEIKNVKVDRKIKIAVLQDTRDDNKGYLYETDGNGQLVRIEELPEPDMGDPTTLINFVSKEVKKYNPKKVFLVLWDHGNGWRNSLQQWDVKVAAQDESNNNDFLYMFELKEALEKLKTQDIKINLIGFDECLMGNLEVFYDIANYTEYIVASEYYEPFEGWNYSILLRKISNNPLATPQQLAHYVVDAYREAYSNSNNVLTMVAISSQEVNTLVDAINKIAQTYLSNPQRYHDSYLNAVPDEIPDSDNLVDLYTFALNLNATLNIGATNTIVSTIKGIYKWTNKEDYQGVSIYLPQDKQDVDSSYFCEKTGGCITSQGQQYYNPFTDTLWDDFLKAFLGLD